jgi:DNA-binding HxlR family transcriptional regulator
MGAYGQFCPISKALEVLGEKWAMLLIREVLTGSSRYGEIARNLPGCPPATLSKRLKELTGAGVLQRVEGADGVRYEPTPAAWELYDLLEGLGRWGQRWVRSSYPPEELHPDALMWGLRSHLDPAGLGTDRAVVHLTARLPAGGARRYWIVVEPGEVDLCLTDPDRPVDVVVDADLRALTMVWMGDTDFAAAEASGDITVTGPRALARRIGGWIGHHPVFGAIPPADCDTGTPATWSVHPA